MKSITITITSQEMEALFGPTWEEDLANDNGYTADIPNQDYVPGVGEPTIQDPAWEPPIDFNPETDTIPMVDNPNYTAPVGEPTIPNKDSMLAHIGKKIKENGIKFTAEPTRQRILRQEQEVVKAKIDGFDNAVKQITEAGDLQINE